MPMQRKDRFGKVNPVWQIWVYDATADSPAGRKRRESAKTTNKAEATTLEKESWAREQARQKLIKEGAAPPKPKRSWEDAGNTWLLKKKGKATLENDRARLRYLWPHLGHVQDISIIDELMLKDILEKNWPISGRPGRGGVSELLPGAQAGQGSPANTSANKYISLVRAILAEASKKWKWGNVVDEFECYAEPAIDNTKFYTRTEWRKLYAVLKKRVPHMAMAALFAVATGLRQDKVFKLRWVDVDFEDRALGHEGNATKRGNYIPLNQSAMTALVDAHAANPEHQPEDFVFMFRGEGMNEHGWHSWKKAHVEAGVKDKTWHGLRHTFNSWLAQNDVAKEHRKRLVGHGGGSGDTNDRYTHLEINNLRKHSNVIDAVLETPPVLPGVPTNVVSINRAA